MLPLGDHKWLTLLTRAGLMCSRATLMCQSGWRLTASPLAPPYSLDPATRTLHGNRLNLTESELAVVSDQCLDRRIANDTALTTEVAAWCRRRKTTTTAKLPTQSQLALYNYRHPHQAENLVSSTLKASRQ